MSAAADPKLRQKQPVGIAAGAEDAKYQAKYKELKRKVKDIEADNDKLHFKVLQAKLTIRRMKMERAILYERLTTIPPSPSLQDRHPLPPMSVLQGAAPVGQPHPALTHLRPPGGAQPQHRDYPFHSGSNVDLDQQRVGGGGPAPHIHAGHHPHHHQQHSSHSRAADPRMNLTPGIDPRSVSVDNQPASSPRLLVHSPPARISSTHEGSIPRQSQHTIPPTSAPYEPRGASNIPHDNHHVHTSPALSHHNTQVGGSHSRKRSHSHSSPRTHQIEAHSSTAQPYRVLSSGLNNTNNPGHGPGSGTVTPAGPLGQQALHQYPENLAPVQPPLNSPPLSEVEFERGGRSHHPHPHLHQQLPHQHGHTHSAGGGHQHPHSQHPHHHHVVHHHHQHNHPHSTQAQAHAQNEYGGGLPVGDPPTSSSPAIQAHGAGYESAGGRGTVSSGPPVAASASGAPPTGSSLGPSRTHAHLKERGAYDYPPTNQPEGRRERDRDRERDGGREGERGGDADREWERERDRAREYSRGELINYSPPHHRTRSSQSRPLSRTHSQSHPASGGHSQNQTAASANHSSPNLNPSGEYEHSASNSSRGRTAPSSAVPAPLPGTHGPQTQYHSSPEDQPQAQAYRDYPPDANTMYASRLAPSSRAASPGVPSNAGSGSAVGHTTVAGPDSVNSGPRDRDRDREGRERQQTTGPPRIPSPAAVPGSGDNVASDHNNNQSQDSGRKRSRNEMEMEADEEYQANNDSEGGGKGRRNAGSGSGSGREGSLQPQDESRGAKRYHRQTDSSPERERR